MQILEVDWTPQIQEIKDTVELPLTHPEPYEDRGIKPPKGVILHGEPGTQQDIAYQGELSKLNVISFRLHLLCPQQLITTETNKIPDSWGWEFGAPCSCQFQISNTFAGGGK